MFSPHVHMAHGNARGRRLRSRWVCGPACGCLGVRHELSPLTQLSPVNSVIAAVAPEDQRLGRTWPLLCFLCLSEKEAELECVRNSGLTRINEEREV